MNNEFEIDPMGWRIGKSVVRGEIDARKKGHITGRIWLADRLFPILLNLKGNALRDVAGTLLEFKNPHPEADDTSGLCPVQMGHVGQITASRRMKAYDLPAEKVAQLLKRGEPVFKKVCNCLVIEWFSSANGRVVLETPHFDVKVCGFSWRMSHDEEARQIENNRESYERWSEFLQHDELDENDEDCDFIFDQWEMDEFEWEKYLQESDMMSRRYMEVIEALIDHPDRDFMIAHEMGWDGMDSDDALDDDFDDDEPFDEVHSEVFPDKEPVDMNGDLSLEPIPEKEGREWVRGKDGHIRHPLCQRTFVLVNHLWSSYKSAGIHKLAASTQSGKNLHNLLFQVQTLNAKLSGALDGLAYDSDPDGGFVVACLKRTLKHVDLSLHACNELKEQGMLPSDVMHFFRSELFGIRQDILNLMSFYRIKK